MEILVTDKEVDMMKIKQLAKEWHETLVKGVADCKQGVLALGGEWHMDANNKLLENGSVQENLWGFNIYPQKIGNDALEYISLINIRPAQGNKDMELNDAELRYKIKLLVKKIIPELKI
jgi:hypothetical protein